MRKGNDAVKWAHDQWEGGYNEWQGFCLRFVRMCFGLDAKYPDARTGWLQADFRHHNPKPQDIPRGVPIWWLGGKHGHVAISAGDGMCWSTDIKRRGMVDKVRIEEIHEKWGYTLAGWSEDINGARVIDPKPSRVELARELLEDAKDAAKAPQRVRKIEQALNDLPAE